jgi:hypothetical protein
MTYGCIHHATPVTAAYSTNAHAKIILHLSLLDLGHFSSVSRLKVIIIFIIIVIIITVIIIIIIIIIIGSLVVKTLCYKPEGRGFQTR